MRNVPRALRALRAHCCKIWCDAHTNWGRYWHVPVPMLAVHGDAVATDPVGSRPHIEAIASADKTLRLVPGGLHVLLYDTRREDVRGFIVERQDVRFQAFAPLPPHEHRGRLDR